MAAQTEKEKLVGKVSLPLTVSVFSHFSLLTPPLPVSVLTGFKDWLPGVLSGKLVSFLLGTLLHYVGFGFLCFDFQLPLLHLFFIS